MSSKCISCKKLIRARQQGLQCDGCNRWQHRVCGTGISLADYREAVQTDSPIDWRCAECMSESLLPVAESTPVDFVANSVLESDIDEPTADEPVPDSVAADSSDSESVRDPAVLDESSIIDPPALVEEHDAPTAVTFKLIPDATSKGRPKLVDSRGYSYNIRRRRPNAVDWQCTIRRKVNTVSR